MKLSSRVDKMKPSPTLALAAKAKELKAQGKDVIALSVGEPDWTTLEPIANAGIAAIENGQTKYSPAAGNPELRQAIVEDMTSFLDKSLAVENVSVTSGAKYSIFAALACILDKGDKVGIPCPYWVSYPTMAELCEGEPVFIQTQAANRFKLIPSELEDALKKGLRLILMNSPSNPSGMMYSKDELAALGAVLKKYPDTWILTDDIYSRLVFSTPRAPHLLQVCPELFERTVMIDGASKSYAMTGWRVGWAVGPTNLIKAMSSYQSQTVSCAATFSQIASVVAIKEAQELVRESVKSLEKRKDHFAALLRDIPGLEVHEPDGTFYFWVGINAFLGKSFEGKKIQDSGDFSNLLLESENLVAVPGKEFGIDGYLRMSFAVKEETLTAASERLKSFIAKLS
tara:strand:- start:1050 stop:2246 length:1197 start_codon:yes stop_codon:yes gene_type:complete